MPADPKPTPEDKLLGRQIGGYTLLRSIGKGGMGIVYEAQHERIGQRAAVKVLNSTLFNDDKALQRFFNEARALSVIQHSSIVKIFEYGQLDDGTAFIMMEFLDGEPLVNRLTRVQHDGQRMTLGLALELGRQIAEALAASHDKGIIHRDLKPENVFVVPDPVAPLGERVKLLDFGIAKFLDSPTRKTTVGTILGTPLYMSPEQCEGSQSLDDKVDVYALGVMLYEMLSGHLPFTADTTAAIMRQHMFKEPPPLEGEVPDVPPVIADLVHVMLAKAPGDRSSMREVFASLDDFLSSPEQLQNRPRRELPPANSQRQHLLGSTKNPDPFAATIDGNEPLAQRVTPVSKNAETPRSLARARAARSANSSGEQSKAPDPAGSEPSPELRNTPQAPDTTARNTETTNRQPLMLGALFVLLIIVAVLFIQLRAAHKSTRAITPVIVTPRVAVEKPTTPDPVAAPTPAPPPPPPAASTNLPPADPEPESDNKGPAAKTRVKPAKPRGGSKKSETRGEGDKGSPKLTDTEQPWR